VSPNAKYASPFNAAGEFVSASSNVISAPKYFAASLKSERSYAARPAIKRAWYPSSGDGLNF
jgi:hypothetical protein